MSANLGQISTSMYLYKVVEWPSDLFVF